MANNVNSNLTQRLFAYMQHKVDLTPEITELYKNSLIFLGDQKQIYVPLYNAYVGIGMDAYDAVTNRIDDVEQKVAELKQNSSTKVVTGIIPQRSRDDLDGWTNSELVASDLRLAGDILFRAQGDYDPNTGFSYAYNWAYDAGTGEFVPVGAQQNTVATSGLRLSYHIEYMDDVVDGIPVKMPVKHQIKIDDSLTWSYMTSAYTYTLNFSKEYTEQRIETIYHDLLGVGDPVLVPVSYSTLFTIDPVTGNQVWGGRDVYWWTGEGDPVMGPITKNQENGDITIPNGWETGNTQPINDTASYYVMSTTYNGTYNMNIADGIQTLKEVAYILDQLSDGGLGKVTYVSRSEWETNNWGDGLYVENVTSGSYTGTIYRVIAANGKPSSSQNSYAYYTTIDPDNLGIQMAYSIAGNNAAIADLHKHVEDVELGYTSIRSFTSTNEAEGLVTLSQWNNTEGFITTDANAGTIPNNTYLNGDVNTFIKLDLAKTFVSYSHETVLNAVGTTAPANIVADTTRVSIFEKVNFVKDVPAWAAGTYYQYDSANGSMTLLANDANKPTGWPESRAEAIEWDGNNNYYWIPNYGENQQSFSYEFANDKFKLVDAAYKSNNPAGPYYKQNAETGHFSEDNTGMYIRETTGETYVQHAVVETANHIATTAWVEAYYKDNQSTITDKIENILEQAKTYTGEEINKLDNNSKYSYAEFEQWIAADTTNRAVEGIPGTTTYNDNKVARFAEYVSDVDNNDNYYSGAYVNNKLRSQYISQIVETDGIVEVTATDELPTDQLQINVSYWNSRSEHFNANDFEEITLPSDSLHGDDSNIDNAAELLLSYMYNNGNDIKNLYVKDSTIKTYVKVDQTAENTPVTDSNYTNYYILNNNGEFIALNGYPNANLIGPAFARKDTNSAYWMQLYSQEDSFFEVDLSSIRFDSNSDNYNEISYVDYEGVKHYVEINGTTKFYYLKTSKADKVEYLTGNIQHYDYTKEGGEGQNKITLDVNITNIEDATAKNTGFADAYDVRSYIENIFSWVNLSANVDAAKLKSTAGFYKEYKIEVNANSADADTNALNAAKALVDEVYNNGGKLYYVNGDSEYTALADAATAKGYLATMSRNSAKQPVANGDANAVANSYFYTIVMSDNYTNVYTTEQGIMENPINMAISKV